LVGWVFLVYKQFFFSGGGGGGVLRLELHT